MTAGIIYSMNYSINTIADTLNRGKIAILRTDTLYGVLARADNESAVANVFKIKKRDPKKSCIILIANVHQAYGEMTELLYDNSEPTSVLVDSPTAPEWLLRANTELAYRVPNNENLIEILKKTGPLIAPSANIEGEQPASTIAEAKAIFGDSVGIYVNGGTVPTDTAPSRLLRYTSAGIERLR